MRTASAVPASTCSPRFFALFVLFLYGPLSTILILSFQGRTAA